MSDHYTHMDYNTLLIHTHTDTHTPCLDFTCSLNCRLVCTVSSALTHSLSTLLGTPVHLLILTVNQPIMWQQQIQVRSTGWMNSPQSADLGPVQPGGRQAECSHVNMEQSLWWIHEGLRSYPVLVRCS